MKPISLFIIFLVVVVIQLFVPAKMIFDREDILKTGEVYKFKTQPIDPNDPFRGKYVTLSYALNSANTGRLAFERNDIILLYIEKDALGYARVQSVSKDKKDTELDFIEVKVDYYDEITKRVSFSLPFNRYYVEEFKAQPTEAIYRAYHSALDSTHQTYALVAVKEGRAVLKDVYINDKPILHYLK